MTLDEIAKSINISTEVLLNGLDSHDAMIMGRFLQWIQQDHAPPWWSVPELAEMVS